MNEIIKLLEGKGALTVENVKKAYRALSKKAHPDSSDNGPELFIKLHGQYLEALRIAAGARDRPSTPRRAKYENDLSLILFGFEMMDSRNHRRYYEMALYLLEEIDPAVKGHYRRLYELFRKTKGGQTGNLRRILSGEAAAVSNSLYGDARLCRALFESYSRELAKIAPLFDPDIRESISAFESWLETKLSAGSR